MSYNYFNNVVDKTWCIGNSLSTINMNLTSLDSALYQLSTYAVSNINILYSDVQYLSSTMQNVSATLESQILALSSQVQFVQTEVTNLIPTYYTQQTLFEQPNGQINWNVGNGVNAAVTLSTPFGATLANPTGIAYAGQEGHLVVTTSSNQTISSYGNLWSFQNFTSAMNISAAFSRGKIHWYYDGSKLLSDLTLF